MADQHIEEGLRAFAASKTARTPEGLAVTVTLRQYAARDAITFSPLDVYGRSWAKPQNGKHIAVNEKFRGMTVDTSIILVHEGVHRVSNRSSLDEEISCFELQDDYYRELEAGVLFHSPISMMTTTARVDATNGFPEWKRISGLRERDQLVDHVLSLEVYQDKLDAKWIREHASDWGGLAQRWGGTKGLYLRALGSSPQNSELILDVLESVTNPPDWINMMSSSGGLEKTRAALHLFRHAPTARPRMLALENRWGINLGTR